MDNSIAATKLTLSREIDRLTGIVATLRATYEHLDSLTPADLAADATRTPGIPAPAAAPMPAATAVTAAPVATPVAAPVAAPVATPVAASPARPIVTHPNLKPSHARGAQDTEEKLRADVDAWNPAALPRVELETVYQAACMDRPGHLDPLPATLDMNNPECLRVIGNYLRHTQVEGYPQFCARLKRFTGLGHLYKRMRDKASAVVNRTYPELVGGTYSFPAASGTEPSGATQFAALAALRTASEPDAAAA
jgi:hypothetical protein